MSSIPLTHRNFAWAPGVTGILGANSAHPWVECSNKGKCDRKTGYVVRN